MPRILNRDKICEKCGKMGVRARNLCCICYVRRYYRIKKGIDPDAPIMTAARGSGYINKYGYKIITKKSHPNSRKHGKILEHVMVMSEYIGRPLRKGENVHHKNGIRNDNRIENLELWHKGQPAGQRVEDKINWSKEFLQNYGYKVTRSEESASENIGSDDRSGIYSKMRENRQWSIPVC